MKKPLYLILISLLAAFFCADGYFHRTSCRFNLKKISSPMAYRPQWDLPLSEEEEKELGKILNQQFYALNNGSQVYVFGSDDGRYVIKFFKFDKGRESSWLQLIPLPFAYHRKYLERRKKQEFMLSSCVTAYKEVKEETGLIYVHLNPTDHLKKELTLFDRFDKKYQVDLDKMAFIVQRKGDLIYPRIDELMQKGDIAGAKKVIGSVFNLLKSFNQMGVTDNDPIVRKNFGLLEDRAFQLDIGKMRIDPARANLPTFPKEVKSIMRKFKQWVDERHPELSSFFEEELRTVIY